MTSTPNDPTDPGDPELSDHQVADESGEPHLGLGASDTPVEGTRPGRRRFIGMLAGGAAGAAAGTVWYTQRGAVDENAAVPATTTTSSTTSTSTTTSTTTTTTRPAPPFTEAPAPTVVADPERTLVVIELNGGNDGLATLVPYTSDRLSILRPTLMPAIDELVLVDDEFGITKNLEQSWNQGIGVLQGVGIPNGSGSHFEMERRWWSGTETGTDLSPTGFLGRLCDELDRGDPITGLSLGTRRSPAMLSAKPVTAGLTSPSVAWWVGQQSRWFDNLRAGIAAMSATNTSDTSTMALAREGLGNALDFAEVLNNVEVDGVADSYPDNELGWQLAVAAEVIGANSGVRIFHITHGNFDTHDDQRGTHDHLLRQLDSSLSTFRSDLAERGIADDVLIATTSEFGRRPQQSGTGTDHGAASLSLLAGPVNTGLLGEAPSLSQLDSNDNLVPTISMSSFYATLADSWFGVSPDLLLENNPTAVADIIRG